MLACDPGLHIPREPERRRLGVQFTCDDQQFGFPGNQTPVYIDDSGVKLSTSVLDRNTNGVRCFDAYYEPSRVTMTDNQARTPMGFIGSLKITRSIAAGNAAGVVSSALTRCRAHRQCHLQEQARSQAGSGRDGTNYRNSFSSNDIGIASEYAHETADVSRTIEANVAIRNGDGFYLLGAGDKLKANTTKWNHRSGIYAPNAIDLGATWRRGTGRTHNARRSSVREHRDGNRHDLVHPNG